MCGRYVAVSSPTALVERFSVEEVRIDTAKPNYNVTPRTAVPAVAVSEGVRVLDRLRWGLVPPWAKDLSMGDRMINARADRILESKAYRRPFAKRRCIVPADGFYEWQVVGEKRPKQPWFFRRRDGEPLAFAGLWESWRDRAEGDDAPRVRTCVIVTTEANELVMPVHERMPVMLPESAWDEWLDPGNEDVEHLHRLLVPAPAAEMDAWRVSTLVNKPGNNGPECVAEFVPPEERTDE